MLRIFISYRRDDAEGQAGRLFDDLNAHFGKDSVFMDVIGIEPGVDFRKAIEHEVSGCSVLLVVIGKHWIDASDNSGHRRLDDPNDFVRLETAAALKRDIPVVPVLVQDARMPRADQLPADLEALSWRNAVELTHARWDSDVNLLIKALSRHIEGSGEKNRTTVLKQPENVKKSWRIFILVLAAVITAMSVLIVSFNNAGLIGTVNRDNNIPGEDKEVSPTPKITKKEPSELIDPQPAKPLLSTQTSVTPINTEDLKPMSKSFARITTTTGEQVSVRADSLYLGYNDDDKGLPLSNGQTVNFDKIKTFEILGVERTEDFKDYEDNAGLPQVRITLWNEQIINSKVLVPDGLLGMPHFFFNATSELGNFRIRPWEVKIIYFERGAMSTIQSKETTINTEGLKPMSKTFARITTTTGEQVSVRADSLYLGYNDDDKGLPLSNGQTVNFDKIKTFEILGVERTEDFKSYEEGSGLPKILITLLNNQTINSKVINTFGSLAHFYLNGVSDLGNFKMRPWEIKKVQFER